MTTNSRLFCHLLAFMTVAVWGTTFVSTKVLLMEGLSPAQIFTLRFAMAYVLLAAWMGVSAILRRHHGRRVSPVGRKLRTNERGWALVKRELLMMALGVTGGSLYFLAENEALNHTTATNTSLIVCSCPLFAMMIIALFYPSERVRRIQWIGSLIACIGMIIVVLNGRFVLHLSPVGDLLAFVACLCWAFYSLLMKPAIERYSTMFVTRKVFFYGLLTILPYFLFVPDWPAMEVLLRPQVMGNLLFLGVLASMVCFLVWNWVIRQLGAIVATNWVYFNPISTMFFAWWFLNETITVFFLLGAALILIGMYLADKRKTKV